MFAYFLATKDRRVMVLGMGFYIALIILLFIVGFYQGTSDYVNGYRWYKKHRQSLVSVNVNKDPELTNVLVFDPSSQTYTHRFSLYYTFETLTDGEKEWAIWFFVKANLLINLPKKHRLINY